jgi:5'/3'-nucleotidase SurE
MHILLTNDDSYDSPLFHILYDALLKLGHKITCIMPASEQSWTGKSMTRSGELTATEMNIEQRQFTAFSGTPADCVNFGIYNICQDNKPDLVISGINMGYNVGLSYLLSSGTIGAATEGYLAGIPSIAFSQKLQSEDYLYWNKNRSFSESTREVIATQTDLLLNVISSQLEELSKTIELWTIEIPDFFADNWQVIETTPSLKHYGKAFTKNEDGTYKHCSPTPLMEDAKGTDIDTIMTGHIALNKIDFKGLCQK